MQVAVPQQKCPFLCGKMLVSDGFMALNCWWHLILPTVTLQVCSPTPRQNTLRLLISNPFFSWLLTATGFKKRPSEEHTLLVPEFLRCRALLIYIFSSLLSPRPVYYSRQVYYLFIAALCACLEVCCPLTELAVFSNSLRYSTFGKQKHRKYWLLEKAQPFATLHPLSHRRCK